MKKVEEWLLKTQNVETFLDTIYEIIDGSYESIPAGVQTEWDKLNKKEKIEIINSVTGRLIKRH